MEKNNYGKIFFEGIFTGNPVFILLLGLCPTLGVTSSAINGMSMGLAVVAVLACSNVLISAFKKLIPDQVRIPAFIMIIASLVTIVEMVMKAYTPDLYKVLGLFIPLIVVNCIVLGRAESFASKNGVLASLVDGVGTGLGFTLSLTVLGAIREALGNGSVFNIKFAPEGFTPALIFILAPGAFLTIGCIIATLNYLKMKKSKEG
ncbi:MULTISPECIES: electron transport complex subunit RsxE [Fusobacterium]|uniref:Ion-translocating oxidoreductase complex subunit E n=1 Tax=Fusobacterium varium ATCC 27725 TaxID=469618 RepID=A0ABN5JGJ9_FUSVA|nr:MULTISPECIES: electron transport complex subunit E [Fusobacterium]AVQ30556.1 electron transport complex subunit RsxE [Fusobacterium varium ATCC 27725]EES64006.1 electron transport complex, RnfABCDGE type, E subunit [Fusobacterium varium ATCC 27725]MCD7980009.1 electron transport complex subunit E [Fusobacterium sp.]MCF0171998.1 electron transport complex subunit E [Fusobacterium varium]MCF2672787.1 electron transport complex subunit E [Fusobacterium varium]